MGNKMLDREGFPYDAMVPDPSWFEVSETEVTEDEKTEEIQTDKVQSEGFGL